MPWGTDLSPPPAGNLSCALTSNSILGSLRLLAPFVALFAPCWGLSLLSPFCPLIAPLSKWPPPPFSRTYLTLAVVLLLQHGGHFILKETELLIYLLQERLPLGRVQKAALHQHLRSTRKRPDMSIRGTLESPPLVSLFILLSSL